MKEDTVWGSVPSPGYGALLRDAMQQAAALAERGEPFDIIVADPRRPADRLGYARLVQVGG